MSKKIESAFVLVGKRWVAAQSPVFHWRDGRWYDSSGNPATLTSKELEMLNEARRKSPFYLPVVLGANLFLSIFLNSPFRCV